MTSYGDLEDKAKPGCMEQSLQLLLYVGLILALLASCAVKPPTVDAVITAPDGKVVYNFHGTLHDNKSWAERNLGPIGGMIGEIIYSLGKTILLVP